MWTKQQTAFVQQALGRAQLPIPAGLYRCEIVDSKQTIDNSGRPVLKLTMRVIDGRQLAKLLYYDLRFTSGHVKQTKAFLLACGIRKYNQIKDGCIPHCEVEAEVQGYQTLDGRNTNIVAGILLVQDQI